MARTAKSKWPAVSEKLTLVEAWARDGDTEATIAQKLGISVATLEIYKNEHQEFLAALKRGKEVVDVEVENALLKRAKGYEYTEEKVEIETDRRGKVVSRKVVQTVKQVSPDVGAAAFWLKNRRPEKWRDKPVDESAEIASGDDGFLSALDSKAAEVWPAPDNGGVDDGD